MTASISPALAFAKAKVEAVVIDDEAAKSCKFIGVVTSVRLGMNPSKLVNAGLRDAYGKAVKQGGNAVVLKSVTPQGSFMNVVASAYACPDKSLPSSNTSSN